MITGKCKAIYFIDDTNDKLTYYSLSRLNRNKLPSSVEVISQTCRHYRIMAMVYSEYGEVLGTVNSLGKVFS